MFRRGQREQGTHWRWDGRVRQDQPRHSPFPRQLLGFGLERGIRRHQPRLAQRSSRPIRLGRELGAAEFLAQHGNRVGRIRGAVHRADQQRPTPAINQDVDNRVLQQNQRVKTFIGLEQVGPRKRVIQCQRIDADAFRRQVGFFQLRHPLVDHVLAGNRHQHQGLAASHLQRLKIVNHFVQRNRGQLVDLQRQHLSQLRFVRRRQIQGATDDLFTGQPGHDPMLARIDLLP